MKSNYYGVSKLIFLYELVTANARLVAHQPLANIIFDSHDPLINKRLVPHDLLKNARLVPHDLLASTILDLYGPLANEKLVSHDPLENARLVPHDPLASSILDRLVPHNLEDLLDSFDPLANPKLVPNVLLEKARLVPDDPLKVFRSWSINRESGYCTIVASRKPYTSVDPSLFLSVHGAIKDINGNITSIRLRKLQREDRVLNAEELARSSGWRYDACKCACHEARRQTCSIYNCKRVQENFDHQCKKNCKKEFC